MNAEADVVAAIDALERDAVDELVDWQLADSPAAVAEKGSDSRWWGDAELTWTGEVGIADPASPWVLINELAPTPFAEWPQWAQDSFREWRRERDAEREAGAARGAGPE